MIDTDALTELLDAANGKRPRIWPATVQLQRIAPDLAREVIALRAEIARPRRGLLAGETTLQAIGEPAPHEPPNAEVICEHQDVAGPCSICGDQG